MKTVWMSVLLLVTMMSLHTGWTASHEESEKSNITSEQQEALDQLIKSLEILRSNPESMKVVEEWFENEVKQSEEELATVDQEISALQKQLDELAAKKEELEKKFKTLQSGYRLISRLSGNPLPNEQPDETANSGSLEKTKEAVEEKLESGNAEAIFTNDIAPIFKQNCTVCHGENEPGGNLKLLTRTDVLKGGDVGKVIVPGNPELSVLYQMIIHEAEPYMPLGADMLADEDIQKIAAWIRAEG